MRLLPILVAALALVAAAAGPAAAVEITAPNLENRILATGLDTPTAIAWTPDGRLLVAEKEGVVKLVNRRNAPFGTSDPRHLRACRDA